MSDDGTLQGFFLLLCIVIDYSNCYYNVNNYGYSDLFQLPRVGEARPADFSFKLHSRQQFWKSQKSKVDDQVALVFICSGFETPIKGADDQGQTQLISERDRIIMLTRSSGLDKRPYSILYLYMCCI